MTNLQKNNYFILTGAMGAGKSTLLKGLRRFGVTCIDEPARQILAEQRGIIGDGVPDRDPKLFTNLLLSRSIYQFKQMENHKGSVIYDRGIPDNIGYALLFDLDKNSAINAANQYRYNKRIFFLPAWKEIYKTDDERKMSFDQALRFGDDIRKIYEDLNYEIIDVPMESPNKRAEFIQKAISREERDGN